ncbi:MAG: diadenylate cyclase CdaA [Clostridia bacterium]|nr:diadenylate cyclase CdaA [Clostridia bacterium]
MNNIGDILNSFYDQNILSHIRLWQEYPIKLVTLILDLVIVIFLGYKLLQIVKDSRAWQLVKGIAFLIIATSVSSFFNLNVLNYILSTVMDWGVILIIIIFQPEIRRALEQLGGTNRFARFFGLDKDIITKTKEDIYKVVIAVYELAKKRTGALIVMERDIQIKDIIATGIPMDSEVSPQLLVNIFVPNTPLHDGAVVISNNKIAAAACMLPLASDNDIAKELGTRHRAGIGVSKESDSIAIIVSEETGKVSVAKDGTLIADVREDVLKKILINNIVTKRLNEAKEKKQRKPLKETIKNLFKKD